MNSSSVAKLHFVDAKACAHRGQVYFLTSGNDRHYQFFIRLEDHHLGHLIAGEMLSLSDLLCRIRQRMVVDLITDLRLIEQVFKFFDNGHVFLLLLVVNDRKNHAPVYATVSPLDEPLRIRIRANPDENCSCRCEEIIGKTRRMDESHL